MHAQNLDGKNDGQWFGNSSLLTAPPLSPFMPTGAFNICCPRDCVSRHNGGTSGAPLKPLRDDSALRALSTLRELRGAPAVPPLCRETQSLGQQMLNATVGINGLNNQNVYSRKVLLHTSYDEKKYIICKGSYICQLSMSFRIKAI